MEFTLDTDLEIIFFTDEGARTLFYNKISPEHKNLVYIS